MRSILYCNFCWKFGHDLHTPTVGSVSWQDKPYLSCILHYLHQYAITSQKAYKYIRNIYDFNFLLQLVRPPHNRVSRNYRLGPSDHLPSVQNTANRLPTSFLHLALMRPDTRSSNDGNGKRFCKNPSRIPPTNKHPVYTSVVMTQVNDSTRVANSCYVTWLEYSLMYRILQNTVLTAYKTSNWKRTFGDLWCLLKPWLVSSLCVSICTRTLLMHYEYSYIIGIAIILLRMMTAVDSILIWRSRNSIWVNNWLDLGDLMTTLAYCYCLSVTDRGIFYICVYISLIGRVFHIVISVLF